MLSNVSYVTNSALSSQHDDISDVPDGVQNHVLCAASSSSGNVWNLLCCSTL